MTIEQEVQRQFQQFRTFIGGTVQGYVDKLYSQLMDQLSNFRTAAMNRFTTLQTNQQSIVQSLSDLHVKVDILTDNLAAVQQQLNDFTGQYGTDRTWGRTKVTEIQDDLVELRSTVDTVNTKTEAIVTDTFELRRDTGTLKDGGQQIKQSLNAHRQAMETTP